MHASSTMPADVARLTLPQIEEAASVLGMKTSRLTLLLTADRSPREARERYPEVYEALDCGDFTTAAQAFLERMDAQR